jgi:hypothetical protein
MSELFRASGPLAGVDDIPWGSLQTAYGTASAVPATLSKLASRDRAIVRKAWNEVFEIGLFHQDTVYSATAAAAPYVARIAGSPHASRRPLLILLLAFFALGTDEPYSPAGTAAAVRQAVRGSLQLVTGILDSTEPALVFAISELAAAMPFDLEASRPRVEAAFREASGKGTRWALAGAMAMLGERSADIMHLLEEAEKETELEIYSEVVDWIKQSQPRVEDRRFLRAARTVQQLFLEDDTINELIYSAP